MYIVKIPPSEWLNFELIRSLQYQEDPPIVVITWADGKGQVFHRERATAIMSAWLKIS